MGKKHKQRKQHNNGMNGAVAASVPVAEALPGHQSMSADYERGLQAMRSFYSNAVAWGTNLLTDARDQYSLDDATAAQLFPISVTAWACATYRAEVQSGIGPKVTDAKGVQVEDRDTPLIWFCENYGRLVYLASISRMIWGKVYFLKIRNRAGKPTRLEWLNPLDVSPDIDYQTQEFRGFRVRGINEMLPPSELIVDFTFDPLNDFDGISAFEASMRQVIGDRELMRFAQRYFQSGTMLGGMLTYDGNPSDEEIQQIKADFEQFKGSQNAFKTFVAGGGMTKFDFKPMQPAPVDLAMKDLKDIFRVDTCAAFRVNPILLGLSTASDALSAQNTYQQVHISFLLDTAIPDVERTYQVMDNQWLALDFADWGLLHLVADKDEIEAASKATADRSTTALANVGRYWTLDEGREYTGKAELYFPAIQINPDWSVSIWQAGLIRRNRALAALGIRPEKGQPDGYIYELDPRAKGNPQSAMSISLQHPPQEQVASSLLEKADNPDRPDSKPRALPASTNAPTEPPIEAEVIKQPPIVSDALITKARLYELDTWRKVIRRKGIEAPFEIRHLTGEIVDYVRGELLGLWNSNMVFAEAKRAVRAGEQPVLMGATAEDAADWWHEFDNLQHDIGESWLAYQRNVGSVSFDQAEKGNFAPLDQAALDLQPELVDVWIGTKENPGKLAQVLLAGMAAGDKALQKEVSANPHALRATRALAFNIAWNIDAVEAQDFIKSYAFGLIKQINDTTKDGIQGALSDFAAGKLNIEALHNAIAAILVPPGMDANDSILARAKMIGNTESARAFNQGAINRWARANVHQAKVYTVRDEHVCKLCRGLYGTVADVRIGWDIGGGKKAVPPFHPHCRDYMRPYMGDRA